MTLIRTVHKPGAVPPAVDEELPSSLGTTFSRELTPIIFPHADSRPFRAHTWRVISLDSFTGETLSAVPLQRLPDENFTSPFSSEEYSRDAFTMGWACAAKKSDGSISFYHRETYTHALTIPRPSLGEVEDMSFYTCECDLHLIVVGGSGDEATLESYRYDGRGSWIVGWTSIYKGVPPSSLKDMLWQVTEKHLILKDARLSGLNQSSGSLWRFIEFGTGFQLPKRKSLQCAELCTDGNVLVSRKKGGGEIRLRAWGKEELPSFVYPLSWWERARGHRPMVYPVKVFAGKLLVEAVKPWKDPGTRVALCDIGTQEVTVLGKYRNIELFPGSFTSPYTYLYQWDTGEVFPVDLLRECLWAPLDIDLDIQKGEGVHESWDSIIIDRGDWVAYRNKERHLILENPSLGLREDLCEWNCRQFEKVFFTEKGLCVKKSDGTVVTWYCSES